MATVAIRKGERPIRMGMVAFWKGAAPHPGDWRKRRVGSVRAVIQIGRELAHEGGGDLLLPDGLLEEDQGGDGLAVDILGAEDGEHLPGERLQFGRPPLPEIQQR
jgi:hypothetical protein